MALYVIATQGCVDDAQRHGFSSLVETLQTQVKAAQNLVGFEFFPKTAFLKKNIGKNFRLIGYRVPVQNDELILLLRVLARGGNEYEYFLENWESSTEDVKRRFVPFDDDGFRNLYLEATRLPQPPPLAIPNEEELGWLYSVFTDTRTEEDELLVLETETWVKKMRSPSVRDFIALYHQLLEQIDLNKLIASETNQNYHELWHNSRRVGLVYVYRPDLHRLLLLEPVRAGEDAKKLVELHLDRLANTGDGSQGLSRVASRSYPYLMVLDQDAWLTIQKDQESNLALSPEEADLLESIRRTGSQGELGYPLFINGRAGSGKSTMLQYLAADYLDLALRRSTQLLPIYMTCSRELLDKAAQTVRSILSSHHRRLFEGRHDEAAVKTVVNRSFVVFHDYLYSLLPMDARRRFLEKNFVNYAEFRRLWERDFMKRPEARHIGVDLAWHTIRSYIKGIRSTLNDELAPQEFAALPRRRRSVSLDTYKLVYDRVWGSWYKRWCEENGGWDDQDLAAAVLDADTIKEAAHAAIFCDEAQDFTPIELELILQMSIFSRRSLQPEELKRVPFVFAGDPLQTVNPTGFRWDTVQADFHDRFCAVLDPRRRAQVDINYKELKFNYRSNPGIVYFCNLIQLLRAALIGGQDIQPQEAWWVEAPVQVDWFAADDAHARQQLQSRPELVKVVDCEDGEETEYASGDPILRTIGREEGVFRNVWGPTRAKGLEFPSVVLYRFGDKPPQRFSELLAGDIEVLDDSEARLPYEYFLNRLYVAASRAKGQLRIVDSADAMDRFWRFAKDLEVIDALMNRTGDTDRWRDKISVLVKGQQWDGERIDQAEQARDYENQGRLNRDPYLLRQAALAYRSIGDHVGAGKCLALALEFEGKLKEAGRQIPGERLLREYFLLLLERPTLSSARRFNRSHITPGLASREPCGGFYDTSRRGSRSISGHGGGGRRSGRLAAENHR